MAAIRLEGVSKLHGEAAALRDLELSVADGELAVLVGPSGCGKTTALRLIAGLEAPSRGRVWIGDRDVTDLPPRERDVAMVFQSYALYPHRSVRENLGFGLRVRGVDAAERERRVTAVADALGLGPLLGRRPASLSGGQRQRVALGRAMVREPRAFLLDEPLSNLDARLRTETRAELARLQRRLRATMVYVTHDQEEAMTLGNRIAVLRDGILQQVGPPLEVYRRPANLFVAGFIGSPAMNLLPARWEREGGAAWLVAPGLRLPAPPELAAAGRDVVVGVRPHDLEIVPPGAGDAVARVEVEERLGHATLLHGTLEAPGEPGRVVVAAGAVAARPGERVGLRLAPEALHLFDGGSGARVA